MINYETYINSSPIYDKSVNETYTILSPVSIEAYMG